MLNLTQLSEVEKVARIERMTNAAWYVAHGERKRWERETWWQIGTAGVMVAVITLAVIAVEQGWWRI